MAILCILAVINLIIYHTIFKVYYFNFGNSILREIVLAFGVALVELALFAKLIGAVITMISKIIPILGFITLVSICVYLLYKFKLNKNDTKSNADKMAENTETEDTKENAENDVDSAADLSEEKTTEETKATE